MSSLVTVQALCSGVKGLLFCGSLILLALKWLLFCSQSPGTDFFQARGRAQEGGSRHFPPLPLASDLLLFLIWRVLSAWDELPSWGPLWSLFPLKSCSLYDQNHIMKELIICWTVVCPGCFVCRNLAAAPDCNNIIPSCRLSTRRLPKRLCLCHSM